MSVVVFVAGVQFTVNCSESVPLATYLKIMHRPVAPDPVPSAHCASFIGENIVPMKCVLEPVTVGRFNVGAVA